MKKIKEKIFYSKFFHDIRIKHYQNAYEQGRFEEAIEKIYPREEMGYKPKKGRYYV